MWSQISRISHGFGPTQTQPVKDLSKMSVMPKASTRFAPEQELEDLRAFVQALLKNRNGSKKPRLTTCREMSKHSHAVRLSAQADVLEVTRGGGR